MEEAFSLARGKTRRSSLTTRRQVGLSIRPFCRQLLMPTCIVTCLRCEDGGRDDSHCIRWFTVNPGTDKLLLTVPCWEDLTLILHMTESPSSNSSQGLGTVFFIKLSSGVVEEGDGQYDFGLVSWSGSNSEYLLLVGIVGRYFSFSNGVSEISERESFKGAG